jgi:hypothetical protein
MAQAPRLKGKPQKIAWAILGKPNNLAVKKTAREKEIDHRLLYQYSFRVR